MRLKRTKLPKFKLFVKNEIKLHLLSGILFLFVSLFSYGQNGGKHGIKTVVIDAGHGGKDPGCHGSFAHEKIVCLEMALKLGAKIKAKYPEINVVYTRTTDVFVELIDRANIANKANADLFICIHANAGSSAAYGTETYVLGLHRTEAQQRVMERENSIIALEDDKGAKYKDFDLSPDAIIQLQLQGAVYLNHSIEFAEYLQKEFKRIGRYDRGVKQAGFLVLYKTTMPSVLIETGFLPNPTEEKFIGSADGQEKMSSAMFRAFENYKSQMEGKPISNSTIETVEKVPEQKPKDQISQVADSSGLVFRVQIETSDRKVALNSARFKGLEVYEYEENNIFKYCTGTFKNDLAGAKNYKNELIEKGFNHAFVAAFLNGERISIEKAIKLAEKK
jgi:N-acetylmuramoyl-L-alanine amidase